MTSSSDTKTRRGTRRLIFYDITNTRYTLHDETCVSFFKEVRKELGGEGPWLDREGTRIASSANGTKGKDYWGNLEKRRTNAREKKIEGEANALVVSELSKLGVVDTDDLGLLVASEAESGDCRWGMGKGQLQSDSVRQETVGGGD